MSVLERARDLAVSLKLSLGVRARTRWTRPEIEGFQRAAIAELVAFARAHAPLYRRLYAGLDVTRHDRLPVVDKERLTSVFEDGVTDPSLTRERVERHLEEVAATGESRFLDERYAALLTGGTSGKRSIFVHDRATSRLNTAHVLARFPAPPRRRGRPRLLMVCSSDPRHTTGFYARFLPDVMTRSHRLPADSALSSLVREIDAFDPDVLTTYPSTAMLLAAEKAAGRLRARPGAIWCSGEPLAPSMKRTLAEAFGCPIRSSYGTTEAGQLALECGHGRMHLAEDIMRVEVVDASGRPVRDGDLGDAVLLTHLSNRIMPLIRYRLDDRIRIGDRPCECGSGHRWIVEIVGRSVSSFDVPSADGGTVSVMVAKLHLDLLGDPDVLGAQVVVRGRRLEIRLVARANTDPVARVTAAIDAWLDRLGADRGALEIAVRLVPELERIPATGKTFAFRVEMNEAA